MTKAGNHEILEGHTKRTSFEFKDSRASTSNNLKMIEKNHKNKSGKDVEEKCMKGILLKEEALNLDATEFTTSSNGG